MQGAVAGFDYVLSIRAKAVPATPVAETEPNDDGTPSVGNGTGNYQGGDFLASAANGPYSADTVITAALTPAGDEDGFAITNTGTSPVQVNLETFGSTYGTCAANSDTQLRIRDAAGAVLAFDDDGSDAGCSFVPYVIPAGGTVYAHVIEYGDNATIAAYSLYVSFP